MIPAFNEDGILPPGRHTTTPPEVQQRLVMTFPTSMTRPDIFRGWLRRREQIASLVEVQAEWVDGSFVTAKRDPGDIDVVTLMREDVVNALDLQTRQQLHQLLVGNYPRLAFGCHSFPLMTNDQHGNPSNNEYLWYRGYWDRHWGYFDGEFDRKGYLEVRDGV